MHTVAGVGWRNEYVQGDGWGAIGYGLPEWDCVACGMRGVERPELDWGRVIGRGACGWGAVSEVS